MDKTLIMAFKTLENAIKKKQITLLYKKTKNNYILLKKLQILGYLVSFKDNKQKNMYSIFFKTNEKKTVILNKIILLSKSSTKKYKNVYELKALLYKNHMVETLLYTNKGLITIQQAILNNIGGLLLCHII